MLALIIFIGIVLIISTIINPFTVLPVFVVGAYIEPMQYFPQLIQYNPTTILGVIMLAAWFIHMHIFKDFSPAKSKQVIFIFIFIIFMLVSSLLHGKESMNVFFNALRAIIPYFLFAYIIKTKKHVKIIVWALLICGFICAFYGIIQLKTNTGMYDRGIRRVVSFFNNPNAFGNSLVLLIPFTLAMFFSKKSAATKIIILIIMAFLFAGIVISYSRGATVGFVFAVFLFVMKFFRKEKKIIALFAAMFFVLLAIYFFPARQKYTLWARVRTVFRAESAEELDSGRAETTKAGMIMMMKNPLLGVGLGNFTNEYINLAGSSNDIKIVSKHAMVAHNLYAEIGSQLGAVALALYLMIIFSGLKNLQYCKEIFLKNKEKWLFTIVIALEVTIYVFIIYGFMGSGLTNKVFWIILSLSVGLKRIAFELKDKTTGRRKAEKEYSENIIDLSQ